MNVRAISITQPLIEGLKTAEDVIIHNARVSNPANQLNVETGDKLIGYCIKNKHWSIFDQVDLTIEVTTSRAIAAQILRHKSMFFQELSQRYSKVSNLEPLEWRMQGKTNRQVGDAPFELPPAIDEMVGHIQEEAFNMYNLLIEKYGVAKECARMILPLNTTTTLCVKGTLRSWIHYLELRCSEHTQKEHRDVALACREIVKQHFPLTSKALGY
jgi:thymidylate synthase (FAD)